jgi:hypothetical protein
MVLPVAALTASASRTWVMRPPWTSRAANRASDYRMDDADRFLKAHQLYFGPERPEEVELRPQLDGLPVLKVKAGQSEALLARYDVGECHRNCRKAVSEDASLEHVFGWTVSEHVYLSHSVLRLPDGSLHCITPEHTDTLDDEGCFAFAEDNEFTWANKGMYRSGRPCLPQIGIVRRDVKFVQRAYNKLLGKLRRGEITLEEAERLRL